MQTNKINTTKTKTQYLKTNSLLCYVYMNTFGCETKVPVNYSGL